MWIKVEQEVRPEHTEAAVEALRLVTDIRDPKFIANPRGTVSLVFDSYVIPHRAQDAIEDAKRLSFLLEGIGAAFQIVPPKTEIHRLEGRGFEAYVQGVSVKDHPKGLSDQHILAWERGWEAAEASYVRTRKEERDSNGTSDNVG